MIANASSQALATAAPAPSGAAPIAAHERLANLDILRGFALFGILLVNMALFAGPFVWTLLPERPFPGTLDRAVSWAIAFGAEGKFYTLFSFLFGYGLALQLARAEARGVPFVPLYLRRLFVLLLIGLAHATLLWSGDILVLYAILGAFLLLFRGRRPRTLLIWSALCLVVPVLLTALLTGLLWLARLTPARAEIDRGFAQAEAGYRAAAEAAIAAYRSSDFGAIFAQRLSDNLFAWGASIFYAPAVFALFLLGLWAGRRSLFARVEEERALLRRVARWGLALGLPLNAAYASLLQVANRADATPLALLATTAQAIGAPALALGYAATIALLLRREGWARRLAPLGAAGRLALSNYLLQSLVCTTIFYGYGLGLYGRVGPAAGLLLTVAIFLAQVALSAWWVRHFRFGPAEWLWRSLTYLAPQPFRRRQPAARAA